MKVSSMRNINIVLDKITKSYYGTETPVHALRGVSLKLDHPEMMAIMGPSGSGKSTLMNILGCLDKPDGGLYKFAGYDVMKLDRDQLAYVRKQRIGFVFQNFNLLGRASALENVCLPMNYNGIRGSQAEVRAKELLGLLGLKGREYHMPNQLSGGQQQRVAIARALANDPDLLLADEPTGALDTKTSEEIMLLFQRLYKERSLALVVVTHEPEVSQYCHRVVKLRDGLIISEETNGVIKTKTGADQGEEVQQWIS